MFGLFGISLAILGFGKIAKQEWRRTCETIDSKAKAKKKKHKTYIDGYGCSRLTENSHLIISSIDKDGVFCLIDIDDNNRIIKDEEYLERKKQFYKEQNLKKAALQSEHLS